MENSKVGKTSGEKNGKLPEKKIILAGLDNSGKTSMLRVIDKIYEFMDEVDNLKATVRIEYSKIKFINFLISVFDMGGQEKYRKAYLNREVYFDNVDRFIYLIDIQDPERFNESLDYLEKVLEIFRGNEYDKEVPIFICFTKTDYKKVFNADLPEYMEKILTEREMIMQSSPDFKFEFFSTSIFNIYSIIKMISMSIHDFFTGYKELIDYIVDFSEKYEVAQLLLFDNTGLIIAEYANTINADEGSPDPNDFDETISLHLEFYKKIENASDRTYRFSRRSHDNVMDLCYRFFIPVNDEKYAFYFSVIIDKEKGMRANWDRKELIQTLVDHIITIIQNN